MPTTNKPLKKLKPGDGLYGVYHWPNIAPDKSKPWAVVNIETQDINGRWHATEAEAKDQLKAMYANMGSKALKHSDTAIPYLHSVKEFSEWVEGNKKWVQFYPYDSWTHPIFSDTTVNKDIAEKMVKNFNDNVVGRDLVVEYDHGYDKAKGGKAAGRVIRLEARDNGLYGLVEFNDVARQEIDNGEWCYWSASHYDSWTHPQTNEKYEFVPENPSLTNRPYVRGMAPLNFSDIVIEADAVTKEDEDKLEVTEEWLREQLDLIEQNKTNNHEGGEEVENGDKPTLEDTLREKLGLEKDVDLVAHITEMHNEVEPLRELKKEHSEKKQFSELYPEQAQKLAELEARDREFFAKEFSESISKLRVTRKTGEGDDAKVEETGLGLSALALETIKDGAKEFSEGKGNIETYKKTLDAIFDNGIVDYGTRGSSREAEEKEELNLNRANSGDVRKAFSEKIAEIMEQDKIEDYGTAYALAATKNPELFEAYKTNKPVKAAS